MSRRNLIAGNWKMNGGLHANGALMAALLEGLAKTPPACDIALCAPAVYLAQLSEQLRGTPVDWGAQDVSAHESGAYTGEVSAAMLREFNPRYVIVGHSERRQYHGETDALVAAKAARALAAGITPIVCVGETLAQRDAGQTEEVVKRQLAAVIHTNGHCISEIVVAYEPVWAIGTGLTPTAADVAEVHAALRAALAKRFGAAGNAMRILYGGSVKPSNAKELMSVANVNGALVGGASLKADDFLGIIAAYR